ncbi:hypothetical protein ESY86_19565 [Subsaximicrobium wynnwilliamsii]|uniref:Lipocalin-like domain-containing protein n=1 Tax=Subsaximicrobium wynnwilliamsii TaxID=291179 RepID=A0A5C6ZAL1_9FLAO|nr:hypothetical protein [Subsaximicrobium wynnwilliamsii]TXD80998.1 hypothetical protein ESY87_19635 [Subsaximicrobium wynnwilliamsii]TXD86689.1 hypothetical protein ESY86_19565 [Subsaximicrobium wynnwilliamsii]TXE00332.1 hypothetical protein ESY88_19625 [Subsaximicrobium wynnwilliamsii]
MKTILLFFSFFLIVSCNSNDDDNGTPQEQHEIMATWNLTRFERGFAQPYQYVDEITWEINPDNTINVNIVDGTEVSNEMPLNISGSYNFTMSDIENELLIDDIIYKFQLSNTGEYLLIEDEIGFDADGMLLLFEKIE